MDPKAISHLIDALNQPDESTRRSIMDDLVIMGRPVLEILIANLGFADAKTKTHLIQVIREIADPESRIALMRFVFDYRKKSETNDARALAMKTLVEISPQASHEQMFKFAMDLIKDEDIFVRIGAIQLLGRFGDRRVVPLLEDQLKEDEWVSEAATKALAKVRTLESKSASSAYNDERILQEIRTSQGGERSFFIEELKSRDNAFELAQNLIQSQGRGMVVGLHLMQSMNDTRVREVAREVLLQPNSTATIAIALRLLASNMAGDASDIEIEIIRKNMVNSDTFVKAAATLAASATGNENLVIRSLTQCTYFDSPETTKHIAKGSSEGLPPGSRWIIPHAIATIEKIISLKVDEKNQYKLAVAYLVRTLKHATMENSLGSNDAERIVFRALKYGKGFPQIIIASLELLTKLAPADGYKFSQRWSESETLTFAELVNTVPKKHLTKTLELLYLGAPPGVSQLAGLLRPLAFGSGPEVAKYVIPLLAETHTPIANDIIEELSNDDNPEIKEAANAARRRKRNAKDWIDAQFE